MIGKIVLIKYGHIYTSNKLVKVITIKVKIKIHKYLLIITRKLTFFFLITASPIFNDNVKEYIIKIVYIIKAIMWWGKIYTNVNDLVAAIKSDKIVNIDINDISEMVINIIKNLLIE